MKDEEFGRIMKMIKEKSKYFLWGYFGEYMKDGMMNSVFKYTEEQAEEVLKVLGEKFFEESPS